MHRFFPISSQTVIDYNSSSTSCQYTVDVNLPTMGAPIFSPDYVPFRASHSREVNPGELVGKTIGAIRATHAPDADAPHTLTLAFADGSEYQVRVAGVSSSSETYIEHALREAELKGRRVTACALLRCAAKDDELEASLGKLAFAPAAGYRQGQKHVALGIKLEGSSRWNVLEGYESDWDSDSDCIDASEYRPVYLTRAAGRRRAIFRRT